MKSNKTARVSKYTIDTIVTMYIQKYSVKIISDTLAVSESTVRKYIKQYEELMTMKPQSLSQVKENNKIAVYLEELNFSVKSDKENKKLYSKLQKYKDIKPAYYGLAVAEIDDYFVLLNKQGDRLNFNFNKVNQLRNGFICTDFETNDKYYITTKFGVIKLDYREDKSPRAVDMCNGEILSDCELSKLLVSLNTFLFN